jgi:uncharacterized membrane protein
MNDASAGATPLGVAKPSAPPNWSRHLVSIGPLALAAWSAVALGIALRLFVLPEAPFWLDEAWTGAIIANESLGEVVRAVLLDANAPLYFVVTHAWSLLFGLSNGALRSVSLLFGVLAPLLALVPLKGIPRDTRCLWGVLLVLWFPGVFYSDEARCYTLLLFLVTACTIAYVRLLQQPDLRRASLWAVLGSLCILTHYHAFVLLGLQGLAYLALHRGRALRSWSAALWFAPAFAWSFVHLPHVTQFADPKFAWFDQLTPADLPNVLFFLLGGVQVAVGLIGLALIPLVARSAPRVAAPDDEASQTSSAIRIAVATAVLGAAIVVGTAMLSTSFAHRYLIVFIPGLMLGLAATAVRLGRRWTVIPIGLALVFGASTVSRAVEARGHIHKVYSFQIAADALMAADVRHLAFLWDNPLAPIFPPDQLAALGGFFFKRAGWPAAVEGVVLRPGEDPNERLIAVAGGGTHGGILWIYDLEVRGTAAKAHPPRIAQSDPAWQCRQFGRGRIGILACDRR